MKTARFLKTVKDLAVPSSRRAEAQSGPDSFCDECKKIDFRSLSRLDVNVLRRHDILDGITVASLACESPSIRTLIVRCVGSFEMQ